MIDDDLKRIKKKEVEEKTSFICIGVDDNCRNPDSYGMICVRCNKCGRFETKDKYEKTEG